MSTLQPTADSTPTVLAGLHSASQPELAQTVLSPHAAKSRAKIAELALGALGLTVAVGGGLWWYTSGRETAESPRAVASAHAALPPPAAFEMQLATPDAAPQPSDQAALDQTLGRVPLLAKVLQSGLYSAAEQAAAGDSLFVPLGRKAGSQDIPRHQRWEIRFAVGSTLESYARQLDSFGIELGLIGGSDQVVYLYNLSKAKPDRRVAPASKDQRLYMTWQRGELRAADQQLFARAKVPTAGKIIAQFYPAEVEQQLADAEEAYAKRKQNVAIRKTVFSVTTDNDGFRFAVVKQEARAARVSPTAQP